MVVEGGKNEGWHDFDYDSYVCPGSLLDLQKDDLFVEVDLEPAFLHFRDQKPNNKLVINICLFFALQFLYFL